MTMNNSPKTDAAVTSSTCSGHHAAPADTASEDLALCLVMAGTPVVKSVAEAQGLYRDYEGGRYWFCCAACGPLFDVDPAKYASVA
ncbi:YHS domain-containing protein [Cryobacterium sp. TMT2-15-1]|uniref:YHS domain-containing protein n=1 Tax=Cryobacterium sp. TMT2-15-1 TaxID=1259246 RepID=UPI00106D873D|nr:YHS domain-containing protein [Cryobacterium sp. TMT2-15-1]TFC63145.1 YHS domain-containing protein [Cryobacterium sp. TMT2-15-1]